MLPGMTGPYIAIPIHGMKDHTAQLDRIEALMATEAEQLNELSAKVDDLAADVREAIRILTEERANLSPEGQEAFDALNTKVADLDAVVGDADHSEDRPV